MFHTSYSRRHFFSSQSNLRLLLSLRFPETCNHLISAPSAEYFLFALPLSMTRMKKKRKREHYSLNFLSSI
ncbi:Uncharacterized protein APZ42_014470 [Daphnia magna]|uniref:Uncharacterized protein n=1 Tax=Daphnia magna TaxID=35525 RepID=A0A162PVD3_9CRUS|nr:Uncharacterized protein APZ42_014470 [Daphnia magna]